MNYMDENELRELEKTKAWLGGLLNESLSASCTDFQTTHANYFIEILGRNNVPNWVVRSARFKNKKALNEQ